MHATHVWTVWTSPLALCCLLLPLAACEGFTRTERLDFDEPIERIGIDTGSGDIFVVAEPGREQVEVEAVIRGKMTRLRWSVDEGSLSLDHDCPALPASCAVDWYLWVPADAPEGLDLELGTGSGDVVVEAVVGNVRADTRSGNLTLAEVVAQTLELDTGSGDLSLDRCEADDLEADTRSGNLTVELLASPRRVVLDTGSGDVDLAVPAGSYRLDLDTGSGNVDADGLDHEPDSERLLSVTTGSGNIDLRSR